MGHRNGHRWSWSFSNCTHSLVKGLNDSLIEATQVGMEQSGDQRMPVLMQSMEGPVFPSLKPSVISGLI